MKGYIWISTILSVAILALVATGFWMQHQDFVDSQYRVVEEIASIQTQIDQQTAIINRAFGTVLPLPIPKDVDDKLKELEERVATENSWPTTTDSVEELHEALTAAVADMQPWVQEDLFPRLVPLRWNIEALWYVVAMPPDGLDELTTDRAAIDSLLANQPVGISTAVPAALEAKVAEWDSAISRAELEDALIQAKQALVKNDLEDLAISAEILSSFESPEAEELLEKLNRSIAQKSIEGAVSSLQSDIQAYKLIDDDALRVAALSRASDKLIDIRLALALSEASDDTINDRIADLQSELSGAIESAGRSLESRRSEMRRDYQRWALRRIQQIRKYADIENRAIEEIESAIDRNNPMSDARKNATAYAQRTLRDDMITHLAEIDQGLLDIAVGDWFGRVYRARLEELNDDEKIRVVQAFAETTKKSIGEVR